MSLHEISRRFLYLSKQDDPSFTWQNAVLCIAVNKHITFFDFTYDIRSTERNLEIKENVLKYPSDSPVSTQVLQSYVQNGMKNNELMEMITDPLFRPHSTYLKNEMEGIKCLRSSPDNLFNNFQCLIAVVNNFGNVNLVSQNRCTYTSQLNFTEIITDTKAPFPLDNAKSIDEIKEFVYKVATSAVCWAPNLNADSSCYFVTVQNSGDIFFWSLICNNGIQSKFCSKIQSNSAVNIEGISWIPISNEKIILLCSNIAGQVTIYECSQLCDNFILNKEHIIWQHKDKMVVKCIHFFKTKDKIVLLYSKNRHIIIQSLDKHFNVIAQKVLPVNDEKIVSIVNLKNDYYLGTINTKLYKLNVSFKNKNLNVTLNAIDIKENLQSYELVGIGISQNEAIVAISLKDRRLLHRKESIKLDMVFFSTNNDPTYHLCKLIDNPSQSLCNFWDCIELVRCNVFKNKNIPQYDYITLLAESETNLYKLKVYYIILKIYITLTRSKIAAVSSLPNTDVEEIQERILVAQAVKLLNNLKLELDNKELNSFKKECFVGAKKFLLYFCNKYKKNIGNYINVNILDLVNLNSVYTCQSCDCKLKEFSCTENVEHFNMFCSVTFTPIEGSDYLLCESCGVTARGELYDEVPICVFCDKKFVRFETIL